MLCVLMHNLEDWPRVLTCDRKRHSIHVYSGILDFIKSSHSDISYGEGNPIPEFYFSLNLS